MQWVIKMYRLNFKISKGTKFYDVGIIVYFLYVNSEKYLYQVG